MQRVIRGLRRGERLVTGSNCTQRSRKSHAPVSKWWRRPHNSGHTLRMEPEEQPAGRLLSDDVEVIRELERQLHARLSILTEHRHAVSDTFHRDARTRKHSRLNQKLKTRLI